MTKKEMLENETSTLITLNICNKEQNDESVDSLLKFVGQKPEKNETTHSKTYRHHYQLPSKR